MTPPFINKLEPFVTHCLLDGAKLGKRLPEAMNFQTEINSLYRNIGKEDIEAVGPFLSKVNSDMFKWFSENGWGASWGVLISSQATFGEIYRHFRHFLIIKTEEGKKLYFRFYDPRVLRVFLPTCTIQQLNEFFGPIDYYICEDENPSEALIFSLAHDQLNTRAVDLTEDEMLNIAELKQRESVKKESNNVIV